MQLNSGLTFTTVAKKVFLESVSNASMQDHRVCISMEVQTDTRTNVGWYSFGVPNDLVQAMVMFLKQSRYAQVQRLDTNVQPGARQFSILTQRTYVIIQVVDGAWNMNNLVFQVSRKVQTLS